jgi:processive 1,2-diacylglycerol beta-glucosyltransferase
VILILSAGFGDGHNTAARNVMHAFHRMAPDTATEMVDLFDTAHPLTAPSMKAGYQMLITRAPAVWAWIYGQSGKMRFDGEPGMMAALLTAMEALLERTKPRFIVSTYPLYPILLQQLRNKGRETPPIFTVITDSISIHPMWLTAPSDAYFVADEASKKSALALGASDAQTHVTGFPVSLDFLNKPAPDECASPHGKILYLPSTSVAHVTRTLKALHPLVASGVKLTLPVGKHASRLYHPVTRFIDSLPGAEIEVIGWTNRIPHLLQTHDFVICKAGGAILHESLAACCPAIIDYVVPGQEEGNAELLTSHECGVTTKTPEETGAQAARLLADHRKVAKQMKKSAEPLSEPDAAIKIARITGQAAGMAL